MKFNFDKQIDRTGTDSFKYDGLQLLFGKSDLKPFWVADMDFACPPAVTNAIQNRADHPIYGYTMIPDSWFDAIIAWNKQRHNWNIKKEQIAFCPGIVPGLALLTDAITNPGDKILIQTPVYHPFYSIVKDNERELVRNSLICDENGYYQIDFQDLEMKLADNVKMMILCHPHNPVGRDWNEMELRKMLQLCAKYNVILVSDEIHADLIVGDRKHLVTAGIQESEMPQIVTCMAASKTFNLGGLFTAYMVFENDDLKQKFDNIMNRYHIHANLFGVLALQKAYEGGEEWLEELLDYLRGNIQFVKEFLADNIPSVTFREPEATYLLWLDFRALKMDHDAIKMMMIEDAGLALNSGMDFGDEGSGFMRLNVACPREMLKNALTGLQEVINLKTR
jgi:cystathionine beta-lyase